MDTTSANTTIRKQELEEQDISEISSSLLQEETIKEILMDDKNAVTNLEEEVSLCSKSECGRCLIFLFFMF